jgi:hypothetical protein
VSARSGIEFAIKRCQRRAVIELERSDRRVSGCGEGRDYQAAGVIQATPPVSVPTPHSGTGAATARAAGTVAEIQRPAAFLTISLFAFV